MRLFLKCKNMREKKVVLNPVNNEIIPEQSLDVGMKLRGAFPLI